MKELKTDDLTGIYKELSELVGIEVTLIIYNHYKGIQVVFPTRLLSREYVKRQLSVEYTGKNLQELARKYNYSDRWLRKMISDIIDVSQDNNDNDTSKQEE